MVTKTIINQDFEDIDRQGRLKQGVQRQKKTNEEKTKTICFNEKTIRNRGRQ